MKIRILNNKQKITFDELRELGEEFYQDLVVGAVDLAKDIVVFGGQYNQDARDALVDNTSRMEDVWGFKILLSQGASNRFEPFSIIDVRPGEGNTGTSLDEQQLMSNIRELVESKIAK